MTRTLLVASAGGHVDELMIQLPRLGINESDAIWVTSRTPQTESLLAAREVIWSPKIGSGQLMKAIRHFPAALRLHQRVKPDLLVSTGALLAVPYLVAASITGCRAQFIDSATRVTAPSATGKFAQRFTRAQLFTQSDSWADTRWEHIPSVFDTFDVVPNPIEDDLVRSGVVSLGSEHWPFARAVDAAYSVFGDAEVVWQVGNTASTRSEHSLEQWVPAEMLRSALRDADVVVMHAGVGSVLAALDAGKIPVIMARRAQFGEHIDDHQVQIADALHRRGLAVAVDPDELTREHLVRAASLRAVRRPV